MAFERADTPKTSGVESNQKSDAADKLLDVEDLLQDIAPGGISRSLDRNCVNKGDETVRATAQGFSPAHADEDASFYRDSMTKTSYKGALRGEPAQSRTRGLLSSEREMGRGSSFLRNKNHDRPASKISSNSVIDGYAIDGDDDDNDDDLAALLPETTRSPATHVAAHPPTRTTTDEHSSSIVARDNPSASKNTYATLTTGLKENRENTAEERNNRSTSQRHKGSSTRQGSLDSGCPPGESDLDELLRLHSSSHSGESSGFISGASAACATSGTGNTPSSLPSTCRWNISAAVRQNERKRGNAERVVLGAAPTAPLPICPITNTALPTALSSGGKVVCSTKFTCEDFGPREKIGVSGTTYQANSCDIGSAAAADQGAKAAAAETGAAEEAAAVALTESATKLEAQLELLRTENQALHMDNRRLNRRLQTDIQAAEVTSQRKLLGERTEWQSERDKYEIRLRMLEKELDRLRDQQTQDGNTLEAAMKTFEEQRRMLEMEQEKKYSRLLKAAVEKEQRNCDTVLREKAAQHLREIKQTERRFTQQLEEQRKLFEDRDDAHKQQVSTQRELCGLMEHMKSSAASIEHLTERLATQAAQEKSTLSTKMAEREAALQEIEQRLREQQQEAAKQHSALVALATDFRNEQRAAEDSLAKERERIAEERAEVTKLRHMLHTAEEKHHKAFEDIQEKFQREKEHCVRKQKEKDIDHDRREQRLNLLERRLGREKQSLEEQTRNLEEIRARATARLQDIETEVSEERRQVLQDRDAARSEHLQLLQMRQELELKHSQLQSQQQYVQEEKRKAESLLELMQEEGAEVRRLHAEATEARATIDWRGQHLDQKRVKCAEQIEQLQSVFKLMQKERLELLRHESRLLGAGAVDACLRAEGKTMSGGLSSADLQLPKFVEVLIPTSNSPDATPAATIDTTCPPHLGEKERKGSATFFHQPYEVRVSGTHEPGISSTTKSPNSFTAGRHLKIRPRAAFRPAAPTSKVSSIEFTTVPLSQIALWQVSHPAVRAVERDSLTRTATLLGVCPRPLEASWSPIKHSVETSVPHLSLSPVERRRHCKQSSHVIEKTQDQLNVKTVQDGRQNMRLSDSLLSVEGPCRALLYANCNADLNVSTIPARPGSAMCGAGGVCTATSRSVGSCRRSTSAFLTGAYKRKQDHEAPVGTRRLIPEAGPVSGTSELRPESCLYWQNEPLQRGYKNTTGRSGHCSSAGISDEVSGQRQGGGIYSDSLRSHCGPCPSQDQSVTSSRWQAERAAGEAASVHRCEKYLSNHPPLSRTSLTGSLSVRDPPKTSQTSVPAIDGETQAPPEFTASTSSILSLKSLPTVLCT